jgi:hypothetical protein
MARICSGTRLRRPGTSRTRLVAVGEFGQEVEVGEALLRAAAPHRWRRPPGRLGVEGLPRSSPRRLVGRRLRGFRRQAVRRSLRTGRPSSSATERPVWIARMRKACHVVSSTLTRAVCCGRRLMTVPPVGASRRRVDGSHEGASLYPDSRSHGSSADRVRRGAERCGCVWGIGTVSAAERWGDGLLRR